MASGPLLPFLKSQLKGGFAEFMQSLGSAAEALDADWLARQFGYQDAEQMAADLNQRWGQVAAENPPPMGNIAEDWSLLYNPRWLLGYATRMLPFQITTLPMGLAGGALARGLLPLGARAATVAGRLAGVLPSSFLESMEVYQRAKEKGYDDPLFRALVSTAGLTALNYLPLESLARGRILPTALLSGLEEYAEEPVQAAAAGDSVTEALKYGLNVIPPTVLTGGLMGTASKLAGGIQSAQMPEPERVPLDERAMLATAIDELNRTGGATVDQAGQSLANTPGFAVATYPDRSAVVEGRITPRDIKQYIRANRDVFANDPTARLGLWQDNETGKGYLDISQVIPDENTAARVGSTLGELAIWDLGNMEERRLSYTPEALAQLTPEAKARRAQAVRGVVMQPFFSMREQSEPLPWRSRLRETIERKLPNKNTAAGYAEMLENMANKGEFSREEADFYDLIDDLKEEGKKKLDKADLLEMLDRYEPVIAEVYNASTPQPSTPSALYGLPQHVIDDAIDSYREYLLSGPLTVEKVGDDIYNVEAHDGTILVADADEEEARAFQEDPEQAVDHYIEFTSSFHPDDFAYAVAPFVRDVTESLDIPGAEHVGAADYLEYVKPLDRPSKYSELIFRVPSFEKSKYRNPHFNVPQAFAHMRVSERTDNDGTPMLFIEEIQSDLHQRSRRAVKHSRKKIEQLTKQRSRANRNLLRLQNLKEELFREIDRPEMELTEEQKAAYDRFREAVKQVYERNRDDLLFTGNTLYTYGSELNGIDLYYLHNGADAPRPAMVKMMSAYQMTFATNPTIRSAAEEFINTLTPEQIDAINEFTQEYQGLVLKLYSINNMIDGVRTELMGAEERLSDPFKAPFEKSYERFALKRAIKLAVELGYPRIAWTSGATQAERYYGRDALLKEVVVHNIENGEAQATAIDQLGRTYDFTYRLDTGEITDGRRHFGLDTYGDGEPATNLKDLFYDEVVDRLKDITPEELEVEDYISIEPESFSHEFPGYHDGVIGYRLPDAKGLAYVYDVKLPNVAKKLLKKYKTPLRFDEAYLREEGSEATGIWKFDVNDKMKQEAERGLPLFIKFKNREAARNWVIWTRNDTPLSPMQHAVPISQGELLEWVRQHSVNERIVNMNDQLRLRLKPLDMTEGALVYEALNRLVEEGGVPEAAINRIQRISKMVELDENGNEIEDERAETGGFYEPTQDELGVSQMAINFLRSDDPIVQRAGYLTLAHELGHALTVLPRTQISLLVFARDFVNRAGSIQYDERTGRFLFNREDVGSVLAEVLTLYNRSLEENAPEEIKEVSRLLKYPMATLYDAVQGNILRSVTDLPAEEIYFMPWVVNELWAQLYSLYIVYPNVMRRYMPTAFGFIDRVNLALNNVEAEGAAIAYNDALAEALRLDVTPEYVQDVIGFDIASRGGLLRGISQAGRGSEATGRVLSPDRANVPFFSRAPRDSSEAAAGGGRTGEIPPVIEQAATDETLEETIQRARRGTQPWEETERLAALLGTTPEQVEKFLRREYGTAYNAEQIQQAANIVQQQMQDISAYVDRFIAKAAAGELTEKDMLEFQERQLEAAGLLSQYYGVRAEAGRALQMFRKVKSLTDKLELLREWGKTPEMMVEIAKQFKAIEAAGNSPARFLVDSAKITSMDMFLEMWVNGLLSSVPTHVTNFVSTGLVQPISDLERAIAAAIGSLRGAKADQRVTWSEVFAGLRGYVSGSAEGLRAAVNVLRDEDAVNDFFGKVDLPRQKAIPGVIGKLIRLPSRALNAEDAFWKTVAMSRELMRLAVRQSYADKEGRSADWWFTHPTQQMIDEAWHAAREETFTSPGGAIATRLRQMRKDHKWLTFVIPFINTPANIIRYALQRTPLAPMFHSVREDLLGHNGPIARDMAFARILLGSGIMLTAYMLAASGRLIGAPPDDPKEREAFYRLGMVPYSVWHDGQWIQFNRMEPFGTLLGLAADMWQVSEYAEDEDAKKIASMIISSLAYNLTNKTYLRGIAELMSLLQEPERYGDRFVLNLASTMLPYSVGLGSIARAQDPYLREARTLLDAIRQRIPGEREKLPARIDLLGNPINPDKDRTFFERLVSPIKRSSPIDDPVIKEMWRLGVILPKAPRKFKGVELEPPEYAELVRLQNVPAYRVIERLIQSPYYQQANDAVKRYLMESLMSRIRNLGRLAWEMRHPERTREAYLNALLERMKPGRIPLNAVETQ